MLLSALFTPAIIFFVLLGNLFLCICTISFHYFEYGINPQVNSIFDVIWWGFTTITTVGYGDIVPLTLGGRISGIILMVSGVSFFVGFSGILFSTFMKAESETIVEEDLVGDELDTKLMHEKLDQILAKLGKIAEQQHKNK